MTRKSTEEPKEEQCMIAQYQSKNMHHNSSTEICIYDKTTVASVVVAYVSTNQYCSVEFIGSQVRINGLSVFTTNTLRCTYMYSEITTTETLRCYVA